MHPLNRNSEEHQPKNGDINEVADQDFMSLSSSRTPLQETVYFYSSETLCEIFQNEECRNYGPRFFWTEDEDGLYSQSSPYAEDIVRASRLLDNEIRILKEELQRTNLDLDSSKENIKENQEKIKLKKQLPYLVGNIVEVNNRISRRWLNDCLLMELVRPLNADEIRGLFAPPPWGDDMSL
ncbi:Proteasome endopeptidase complex [Abeliophyllum distichum]|uniref:Proteasome endopeptidase complex n=1 Tax=Abeliophyllum distichum TaxID=126358 RepID=A0ABD1V6A3_9LAMI